jgi:hypothetical protein
LLAVNFRNQIAPVGIFKFAGTAIYPGKDAAYKPGPEGPDWSYSLHSPLKDQVCKKGFYRLPVPHLYQHIRCDGKVAAFKELGKTGTETKPVPESQFF